MGELVLGSWTLWLDVESGLGLKHNYLQLLNVKF